MIISHVTLTVKKRAACNNSNNGELSSNTITISLSNDHFIILILSFHPITSAVLLNIK